MAMDGESVEKHLHVNYQRKRHDEGSRYGGHGGASVVKARPAAEMNYVTGYLDADLSIKRPSDQEGNLLVTALDRELDMDPACEKTGYFSHGGMIHSIPAGRIPALVEQLEAACISSRTSRHKANSDIVQTTYVLDGIGWMAQNKEEVLRLQQKKEEQLSLYWPEGKRLFCRVRDTPLEKIMEKSLLSKTSRLRPAPGVSCHLQCMPEVARVLSDDVDHCFCPRDEEGALEVDLGMACRVSFVSTQGRFPPFSVEDGRRVVSIGDPRMHNWITSYELSVRPVSGNWIVLGTFKGNTDMTTEVAHELSHRTPNKMPVECRYLRFKPLGHNISPAFRIGVYGSQGGFGKKDSTPQALEPSVKGDEHPLEVVEYTISQLRPGAQRRRACFGNGTCAMGCAKCSKNRGGPCGIDDETGPKAKRIIRQEEARVEHQKLFAPAPRRQQSTSPRPAAGGRGGEAPARSVQLDVSAAGELLHEELIAQADEVEEDDAEEEEGEARSPQRRDAQISDFVGGLPRATRKRSQRHDKAARRAAAGRADDDSSSSPSSRPATATSSALGSWLPVDAVSVGASSATAEASGAGEWSEV